MKNYCVTWELELDADSPEEAARLAWKFMRETDANCNCFTVCDDEGNVTQIDLEEENQKGGLNGNR